MNRIKRMISLVLCVTVILTSCALAFAADEVTPVIIVTGMSTLPLYYERGTEQEKQVWPPQGNTIAKAVIGSLPALLRVAVDHNWDAACDKIAPLANDILGMVALNGDGSSKYNVTCSHFDEPYSYYVEHYDSEFFEAGADHADSLAKAIGGDNVYVYVYDWRFPTVKLAQGLNDLVEKVKSDTGSDKVTFNSISQGGSVTMAYLEMFGSDSVENTVMLSSGFRGIELVGDVYSGRVKLDVSALLNMLIDRAGSNSGADSLTLLAGVLRMSGISNFLESVLNKLIVNTQDRLFEESLRTTFGTVGGIWGLVPYHDYATAKQFMFGDSPNNALMDDIDYYFNNVSGKCEQVLNDCIDNGMLLSILSCYGRQEVPFGDESLNQSDGVIETLNTSAGATCAPLGEILSPEQQSITAPCGHNHLSPDCVVNAATCMFPEQTWFVRGMQHTQFKRGAGSNLNELIVWLTVTDTQRTVWSNEQFPQFTVFDRSSHNLFAQKGKISKYYFIDSIKELFA